MTAAWGIQNPDQECYVQDTRLTGTEKAIFQVSTKSNEKKLVWASQKRQSKHRVTNVQKASR